jgi:hypothetical protein
MPQNEMFKNIHQLTNNLGGNKPMTIILTTNQAANTGDGEDVEESDEEQIQDLNQSCSTNDSVFEKELLGDQNSTPDQRRSSGNFDLIFRLPLK